MVICDNDNYIYVLVEFMLKVLAVVIVLVLDNCSVILVSLPVQRLF